MCYHNPILAASACGMVIFSLHRKVQLVHVFSQQEFEYVRSLYMRSSPLCNLVLYELRPWLIEQ